VRFEGVAWATAGEVPVAKFLCSNHGTFDPVGVSTGGGSGKWPGSPRSVAAGTPSESGVRMGLTACSRNPTHTHRRDTVRSLPPPHPTVFCAAKKRNRWKFNTTALAGTPGPRQGPFPDPSVCRRGVEGGGWRVG